ncbi:Integrator complex subunit 6 [Mortierella sp. NVP85]|nr:Integrator complex subunit 6 [Mortierella sp. NVP85]
MILIFLIDSSASMNQKFSNGMSALECTKSGVEHLLKHLPHVRPPEKHNDKFMLVTYEDGPGCIKSSLKDPIPHLVKELKVLKAEDMSNPGASLSTIFDVLNVYRVYHGIDTPASGRFPGTIEPSVILWFTDGGRQSSPAGVLDRLNIPGITSAGVDYYHEPFRWDQRLYTIFLEPNTDTVDPQLSILSTVMGGTSYRVRTLRHLLQAIDCMLGISKIPPTQYSPQAVLHLPCVVVNFEDMTGFFPIPEPFWPEMDVQRLPTRSAQPTLYYRTKEEKNVEIPEGFPYDKYTIAHCPMTQELLARPSGSCWPVYVKNSYKTEDFGFPFGFLKANTQKSGVTLTVVAYNYPALFTLLVKLNTHPGRTPTPEWLRDFSEYLSHTPSYYYVAKSELDRFLATEPSAAVDTQGSKKNTLCTNAFDVPRSELISALSDLKGAFFKELQIISIAELITPTSDPLSLSQPKPTQSIARMANMRLEALTDSDDLHSLPIADMGIYQERMQKIQQENLRDPFRDEESVKSLQKTMFGNPYKQDKKVSIDEEDEVPAADTSVSSNSTSSGSSWSSIFGRKRKPRRRSVSPSHFPIEKIPSLAKGDGSMSGREQSLSIGPPNARATLPLLRIVIHDGSGKTRIAEDMTERHVVMHDGEDDSDDEDEYRRAVFNSDEMELDNGDEAARLRADTPMPGGIGLDDDDQDMEDMHHAQDMIPPPLVEISRDDIVNDGTTSTLKVKETTSTELMQVAEYDKHRQDMQEDLDHLNGAVNPVFQSLVYDPTALMELQSIPPVIPEQKPFDGITPTFSNGSKMYISPQSSDGDDSDNHPSLVGRDAGGSDSPQNLMPIPLLLPLPAESTTNPVDPIQSALTLGVSTEPSLPKGHGSSIVANGKSDDKSLRNLAEGATVPCNLQQTLTTVKPPLSEGHSILKESPQEFRNMMIKHMKMDPRNYDDETVIHMVWRVDMATNWTKEQKRTALGGCLHFAKGMRRATVVSVLEPLVHKLQ